MKPGSCHTPGCYRDEVLLIFAVDEKFYDGTGAVRGVVVVVY